MLPALILPFHGITPVFAESPSFAGPRSAVLGRATVGRGADLCADSVIRADGETVALGDNVHLGPRATVHIVHDQLPTVIGNNVTVGAFTVIHACRIGDDCVIEHDVAVLDDAEIAAGVLIEAGSTVFPRKRLEGGWVYAGSPAKPVRELAPGELASCAAAVRARDRAAAETSPAASAPAEAVGADVFLARTAQRFGRVKLAPESGLFFSCIADAGSGTIRVGENSNVQDNTIIRVGDGDASIGQGVTVGHNVRMGAVRIGDDALIGMSVHLADGVWVHDDVFVAAGATTEPGQMLESGWLWGGRPARPLSRLDDARRAGMRLNIEQYCGYMRTFRTLQNAPDHARTGG